MRIVIDARLYGLKHRGIGRYVMELVHGLAKLPQKHEYLLLINPNDASNFNWLSANFTIIAAPWRVYTLAEQIHLPWLIKRLKPQLVHWTHFSAPFFCPAPYIVTIHDLILHHAPNERASKLPPILYWLKILGYRRLLARLVKQAKAIITVSRAVAADIKSFYGREQHVYVTYLGVFKQPHYKIIQSERPYFLMVGSAYPHKNIERAVKAFKRAGLDAAGYKLYIVGVEDFFMIRLKKWVMSNHYDEFTEFKGEVDEERLAGLYHAAYAYMLPSLYEGFGLGAVEALSSGVPVVAADIPVLREVLGPAAIYAEPTSEDELARAMLEIGGLERRSELLLQGREIIKRYDWSLTVMRTLDIYESLIEK